MTPEEKEEEANERLDSLLTKVLVITVALTCSAIFLSTFPSILGFAVDHFTP